MLRPVLRGGACLPRAGRHHAKCGDGELFVLGLYVNPNGFTDSMKFQRRVFPLLGWAGAIWASHLASQSTDRNSLLLIGIPFFIPSAPFPPKARGRWGFGGR